MRIATARMGVVAMAALLAACDAQPPPVAGSAKPVAPAPTTTIATPLGPSASAPTGPLPPVRPANAFTDGQMLTVLSAANAKEIETSRIVAGRTKDPDVKAFADMMVQHHGDAQKKLDDLGEGPGKREPAPEATTIEEDTRAAVQRFPTEAPEKLDAAYIDAMVRDHTTVLELVTTRMLPVVTNAKLKSLLADDLRPTIEKHLERAKELASKRGTTGGAPAGSAPPPGSASAAATPTGHPAAGASSPKPSGASTSPKPSAP
jgi:putative membrane protein